MFRSSYFVKAAAVVLFLAGCVFSTGTAFAGNLEDGKELLFENMDIVGAHAQFDAALAANPDGQVENFWHAITVISSNSALKAKLQELKIFDGSDKLAIFDSEGDLNYVADSNVDNIIIDDNGLTYTNPANWIPVPKTETNHPYNDSFAANSAGSGTATWTPNILTPGYYKVLAWIPSDYANTDNAKYSVGGNPVVSINQIGSGGGWWVSLGEYDLAAGSVNITLSADGCAGCVVADAVKLEYMGAIRNDTEAGFGSGWIAETDSNKAFKRDYRWHAAGSGSTATWTFNGVDTAKKYLVYARWPRITEEAAPKVQYVMSTAGTQTTVTVSQSENANEWCCLGMFQFSGTIATVTLNSSADGKVAADAVKITPARPYPDLTQGQDMLNNSATGMMTQIDEALANLSKINNAGKDFTDSITFDKETITLDYGDAKAIEAGIYLLKAMAKIDAAYDMDSMNMQSLVFNQGHILDTPLAFLNGYPDLFKLLPDADASLFAAKIAILNAIDSYMLASEFILARSDSDGLNHMIAFYEQCDPYDPIHETLEQYNGRYAKWQEDKDTALDCEQYVREKMTDVKNNLADHDNYPYITIPAEIPGMEDGPGIEVKIDLYEFFTDPKNVRNNINAIMDNGVAPNIVLDDLPDPTAGGVLPDFTPRDWNFILDYGPVFKDDPQVMWDADVPSVRLEWDASSDEHRDRIVKYKVYRSTSADMADASPVATITDPLVTSCVDTSVDASEDNYYYRVHTFYYFGDGYSAETYTEVGKAILRVYVDANSAVGEEEGTRAKPYKKLGDATSEGAGNGTRVCVAAGTYQENTNSLKLWRASSIVLEGGYEGVNWTRNIASNETIIDSYGLDPSNNTLSFWNNTTIDGFTVVGQVTSNCDNSSICVGSSSSIVIRNCKIRGANTGIQAYSSSRLLIENCLIEGIGSVTNGGSGINIYSWGPASSVIVKGCHITNWSNGGIRFTSGNGCHGALAVFNNVIDKNKKTGVSCWGNGNTSDVSIQNNTIVGNRETGGIYFNSLRNVVIKNNVVANNNGGINLTDIGIYGYDITGTLQVVANNDSYGHVNGDFIGCSNYGYNGNINTDPLFIDEVNGNYRLSQTASGQAANSPCVNAGSDTAANLGLQYMTTRTDKVFDSGVVDMGYHYPVFDPSQAINITGTVMTKWDMILSGIEVSFWNASTQTYATTTTDVLGVYSFTGLPAGESTITARP
ncbi:MAG: right-handed parallel beta-helix repeat-containing protein, partial [Candidatus Omnitrophica bacterium]|nr:right-handed parallel beta-helix repeat-containing protein [Candidatus Omnitrophota bacterium]